MKTTGLSLDQAPPLAVPLGFFALVPLALLAAGALLAWHGGALLQSHWLPRTAGWAHVLTLGVLLAAMFGALYQLVPVVLGVPVYGVRLGHGVTALLAVGGAGLAAGLLGAWPVLIAAGGAALAAAIALFLGPIGRAVWQATAGGATQAGMRGALACLLALALLGLRLAWGHAVGVLPPERQTLLVAHVTLGLLGWVGGLMAAVTWKVVPMFYLTAPFSPRWTRAVAALATFSPLAAGLAATLDAPLSVVIGLATPAALAIWGVQPWVVFRLFAQRRRRREDATLLFWLVSTVCGPLALAAAITAWQLPTPSAPLLFGWLAILGWAGTLVHGMLLRIVPFIVWFHRFAACGGQFKVPPMRQLLPNAHIAWNFRVHALAVGLGAVAIVSGVDALARAAGLGLAATGGLLAAALIGTLRRSRVPTT